MLYKYLVEKLIQENENAPLDNILPYCVQDADIFFSSYFERFAFTPLLCGHRGQVLDSH